MTTDRLSAGKVAVISGGAAGIGLAAARAFARRGMAVAIADVREDLFPQAVEALEADGAAGVLAQVTDVSRRADWEALDRAVTERFGGADVLMCNAGIQPGSDILDTTGTWQRILDTNLWGVIHGCQTMVPGMIARGRPGLVINTGSKQGITTPPGDPAYNTAKAGVKVFTEALAHALRTDAHPISVHLLIPGFVFTELTRQGRTEKPAGAWTPEQTVDFMLDSLDRGDFYILCPDNDVPRALDERRIAWAAGDIVENRPPLSRWHPDHAAAFEAFVKGG